MNDFAALLKKSGLKKTPQRAAVLEIISSATRPLSADDIFALLAQSGKSANLSTVYRILETLALHKLIGRLYFTGSDKVFYDSEKGHKHYLVCKLCSAITAVYDCPLEGFEKRVEQKTGYVIDEHKLYLYGHCPVCAKKD